MDNMIEMKDLQEEADNEDEEVFDLEEMMPGDEEDTNGISPNGPAEPGEWLKKRIKRQNRCMISMLVLLLMATVAYVVGGMYWSDDEGLDALVEPFDRDSGTVEDGAENEKAQQAIDRAHNIAQGNGNGHWGGHNNPFANKVNNFNNNKQSIHQPQGGGQGSGRGKHGSHFDKFNPNSKRPGNLPNHHSNGQANSPGQDDSNGRPDADQSDVDDNEVYCEDLRQYQAWFDARVTKKDGPMFHVHKKYDHDKEAFTQGLTYARGKLFESTGLYGKSTIRILDPDTIDVVKAVEMDNALFGEGMAYYKDTLVQITWKSQKGFIYNISDLSLIDEFHFSTTKNQGWGITWDRCRDELIVTDGSEFLHFWDPVTMSQKRKVPVTRLNGTPARELNEIEFWRGRILANVWFEDVLLVINPQTGQVEKEYDFSSLWPKRDRSKNGADVFNGISISRHPSLLYVTGKNWDRMFAIELLP